MVAGNPEPDRIAVTQTEAARLMGVTEKTIRRWDRTGVLAGTRIGGGKRGVVLYSYAHLKQLIEGQQRGESR